MTVTLDIDEELIRAARREAADRGVTLDELVEEALRARFMQSPDSPEAAG